MFHPQQQIGPYTLVRQLGRGGFGEVWLAEKRGSLLTPQVALKLPLDPDTDLEAVRREAHVWLQASGHPNVLPVIDAEVYGGQVVIVSEYAAGGSLASWLKQHGGKAPSVQEAVELTAGILAGLEYLHRLTPEPIIHRDLKPDNVLLQGGLPRLTDFGISRVLKTTAQTQHAAGTPHYMPPEAFKGRYSPQSDVWAAGVILYQMLSGRLPFPQSDIPSLYGAILNDAPPPLLADAPTSLRNAVANALAKDPAQRPQSAAALRALLQSTSADNASQLSHPQLNNTFTPLHGSDISHDATHNLTSLEWKRRRDVSRRAAVVGGIVVSAGIASIGMWKWLAGKTTPPRPIPKPTVPTNITFQGHTKAIRSVALSLDGTRLVTGSEDETARVWDTATGQALRTFQGYHDGVLSVAFSADGKRIVLGAQGTAWIYHTETGQQLLTVKGHSFPVNAVALSGDGLYLVTGSGDKTAKVWDANIGNEMFTLTGHTDEVSSVAISADSKYIVTGSQDKTARIWDAASGKGLHTLIGHGDWVNSVAISADDRRIVTGSNDRTAKVWDAMTGDLQSTLVGHFNWIDAVALSVDGKRIATGSEDKTAKIWDANTGKELLTLTAPSGDILCLALTTEGKRLITGDQEGNAILWTLPSSV